LAGWGLVALDVVDTTTPQGTAMAQVLAVFAELERRHIGERTKAALAVKRAQGVRLGRPPVLPVEVVERIVSEARAGASRSAIGRGSTPMASPRRKEASAGIPPP
jgi:DNA invertase Pin-like site-specific DNA recombinase